MVSQAEQVALYILRESSKRHGVSWLGSSIKNSEFGIRNSEFGIQNSELRIPLELSDRTKERLKDINSLTELISRFQLKGIREDSRQGLLGWLEGRYPLTLLNHPPSPEEMLDYQCRGERVVTLLPESCGPIGRHAGPFEFLLHDLEHAHKFFGGGTFAGQKLFFNLLREALRADHFSDLRSDSKFRAELDYLMADMNSHPLHLLKYLKAIVLEALPGRRVSDLDRWCDDLFQTWNLPPPVREAARKINYPALENNEARLRVSDFFAYN